MQAPTTLARRPLPTFHCSADAVPIPPMAQSAPREEAFELLPRYTSEHLRIQTLGQFRVRLPGAGGAGGAEPQWITPQSVLLLKCLVAAPGQELTHDELIELLWPECAPEQGRRRLRDALSKLRRALEPHEPAYGRAAYRTP